MGGEELFEEERIQQEIVAYYESLSSESEEWRPFLERHNCPVISEEENDLLQAPFEQEEILNSIKLIRIQDRMATLWPFSATVGKS